MNATPAPVARQRVVKVRRDYNAWVARETMEDHALRFTPRSFRRWSEWRVAQTALGGAASFLVLEALGATLLLQHGFVNAALAILATGAVIALAGWPVSVYAARHGVDMDLLTRGAGFGYIGSTITSLIYACFTFIFFALEAAVMAYALELAFGVPPAWGYLVCALVVFPLVLHGVTTLSVLQGWTLPIWLAMLLVPLAAVLWMHPGLPAELAGYPGLGRDGPAAFDALAFGTATTVGIALITQMGEQVDYLRFMPEPRPGRRARWWAAVAIGGPGWVLPGVLKMLGGALLAYFVLTLHGVDAERAVDPNRMYLAAYGLVLPEPAWAVAATALFVIISQLRINVTNAYAGSLAWSNFFSRLTHSHPGRVVWMVFNVAIALALMEMGVFEALGHVLGLYANVAIAWMMAVVADLVINKPMGWSPPGIEFKRAYLYDVNPVGVGAMGVASALSIAAHLGAFGPAAQAYSAAIALVTAFVTAPLIAWATRGRYYLARRPPAPRTLAAADDGGPMKLQACCICERSYEGEDMAHCPAYGAPICSLCCTLDARCDDLCKPQARLSAQWRSLLQRALPRRWAPQLDAGLADFLLLMLFALPLVGLVVGAMLLHARHGLGTLPPAVDAALHQGLLHVALVLLVACGVAAWWLVLAQRSRRVAQEESNRQTQALLDEIESHRRTDAELQRATQAAESANQAKSRYISAISHELRTPLNSILGYAQLLEEDAAMPPHRQQAVRVIRRAGDHLLGLVDGTLDLARIEAGRLVLRDEPMHLTALVESLASMVELQARAKGLRFVRDFDPGLPAWVRGDEGRLRQVLINLLGNAVQYTDAGEVQFRVTHRRGMARFEVRDTGPGLGAQELQRVFEPFVRGGSRATGSGLGLTIGRMLAELMGGALDADSTPGDGSVFTVRLYLPAVPAPAAAGRRPASDLSRGAGPDGTGRRVLVVDDMEAERTLMRDLLEPRGYIVETADSGEAALARLADASLPRPDAVLTDLAMPGLGGWETVHRLRAAGHATLPVAVVSADAFDRAIDADLGITPADIHVKPVRLTRLLAWLEDRLPVREPRIANNAPAIAPGDQDAEPHGATPWPTPWPSAATLHALHALATGGHLRRLRERLAEAVAAEPQAAAFLGRLQDLARDVQMERLQQSLRLALADEPRTHP